MKKKVSALLLCLLLALTPMLGACTGKIKTTKDLELSNYADQLYKMQTWDLSLASQLVNAYGISSFQSVDVGGVEHELVYLHPDTSGSARYTYDGVFNMTRHTRLFDPMYVYDSGIEEGNYTKNFQYELIGSERRILLRTADRYTNGVFSKKVYSAKTLEDFHLFDSVDEYEIEEVAPFLNMDAVITTKITTKSSKEVGGAVNEVIYVGYDEKHPERTVVSRVSGPSAESENNGNAQQTTTDPRFVEPAETENFGRYSNDFILIDYLIAETENYDGGWTIQFFDKDSGKTTKLVLPAHTRDFAYSDGNILYTVFTPVPFDATSGYNLYVEGKSGDSVDHGKSEKYKVDIYSFDIRKGKTKTLRPGYIPMEFESLRRGNAFDALTVTAAPISGGVAYYSDANKAEYLTDEAFKVGYDLGRLGIDLSYLYTISGGYTNSTARLLTRTTGSTPSYLIIDNDGNTVASLGTDVRPVSSDGNKVMFIVGRGGKYGLLDQDGKITHPFEYDSIIQVSRGIILASSTKESLFIERGTGSEHTIDNTFLGIGNDETLIKIDYEHGYYLMKGDDQYNEIRFRFIGNTESSWGFYFNDEYGEMNDFKYRNEFVGLQRNDNDEISLFAL